jgi:hypothetical protein
MTDTTKSDELLEAIINSRHDIVTTIGREKAIEAHHINAAIDKYNKTPMNAFSIQRKTLEHLTTTASDSVLHQIEPNENPNHGYKFVKAALEQHEATVSRAL